MLQIAFRQTLLGLLALGCATLGGHEGSFAIHVVDETGQPVPCVQLTTPQQIALTTNRDGVAAFWEPGLMGRDVYFTPTREGWQHAADPTGLRGRALRVVPGGSGTLRLERAGPTPACDAQIRGTRSPVAARTRLFRIDVIDAATGRGVPLIELRTPDGASYWTDNQGIVAFDDLSGTAQRLTFQVRGDGYRLPDPSGSLELEVEAGGHAVIALERLEVAERLYRVTGTGLFRDSLRLGLEAPIRHPLVNAGVAGQDSVQAVLYRGNVFWIWGDTPSIAHPLWNYHTSGATSRLPSRGGLDPALGIDLDYQIGPDGNVRAMAAIPGPGATWLTALVNVPDARGEETLFALYGKHTRIDPPDERGLARFDPEKQIFLRVRVIDDALPVQPHGSALLVSGADGTFVHYADDIRIPARAESLSDPASWESFTPFPARGASAERGAGGEVRYAWRRGARGVDEAALRKGRLAASEALFGHVRDIETGQRVVVHATSTAANPYRARFVRIFSEIEGSPSRLGEVWYAEGDTPMGPWRFARKIASHQNYSFYNPVHHAFFDQRGGRTLFFEGTYSTAFAQGATPTPRYDYNQIMYRLDLEDPRLLLPVPIYDLGSAGRPERFADKRALRPKDGDPRVAFFAHDRPAPGTVPVWWSGAACGKRRLVAGGIPVTAPLFYAYTESNRPAALHTLPLATQPLAFVLGSPLRVRLPVSAHLPESSADAGPDRCLREERAGAGARFVLDGTGSHSPRAVDADYAWSWPGGSASGRRVEAQLPAGLHDVRLEIMTPDGLTASDAAAIEVAPALTAR